MSRIAMSASPWDCAAKLVRFAAPRHPLVPSGAAWNAPASNDRGRSGRMPAISDISTILTVNFALCVGVFVLLWLVGWAIRDVSFIDSVWALGLGGLAVVTCIQVGGAAPRQALILALCGAWALRLGLHLLLRWRWHGPDRRYVRMMEKAEAERGWGFGQASLRMVFLLQAPLIWVVGLPVQLGQMQDTPEDIGWLGWAGAALSILGIAFETVADLQITRFKADPANQGKVLARGLWRYTRHPNYFGDICVWVGLYLVAAETKVGLWSLPGPLLLIFLLTRWSGGVTYERRLTRTRPGYDDYRRRTSALIPWPPKSAQAERV
jgi:steroid 5-alpha reductase family enzyme